MQSNTDTPCKHESQSSGGGLDGMCLYCGADVMVERVNEYLARPSEVQTDGLVDIDAICDEAVRLTEQSEGGRPLWQAAYHGAMLTRIALQRSNAEKDDCATSYAEAAYQAGWKAARIAFETGRINSRHAEEWFERNPFVAADTSKALSHSSDGGNHA